MAYDDARLIEALQAADAAGDVAAARQIAKALQANRQAALVADAPAPDDPGFLQRVGAMFTGEGRETRATQELPELASSGILAGLDIPALQKEKLAAAIALTSDPAEIAQMLKAAAPDAIGVQTDEKGNVLVANNVTGARAAVNKPGLTGMDAINFGALLGAYSPAGRVTQGAGIAKTALTVGAKSAATQAGIEALQASEGGEFNIEEVGLAGGLGAAGPVLAGGAGRAVDTGKRLVGAARQTADDPLVAAARQANIPLMTTDVVEPSTYIGQLARKTGESIPFAGTGGPRAAQQAARENAIRALGERYPAAAADPERVVASLKASTSDIKRRAGQRYEELIPKVDAIGTIRYDRTADALNEAMTKLSRPDVLGGKDALSELQEVADTLGAGEQTFSKLKESRSVFRNIIDSYDGQAKSQMPSRDKGLLANVYAAMTDDMDDAARAALSPRDFGRLKQADAIWMDEAQKLTRTRLKQILDKGDIQPEVVSRMIFSKDRSEVKNIYQSLSNDGREAMRASIINRAIQKAGGLDDISPDKFLNELTRMQTQTGIAFKGQDKAQVEGLREVLKATKRASQAGAFANTGAQNYPAIAAAGLGSVMGNFGATVFAGGSIGMAARAYESPMLRNALIRIGKQPNTETSKRLALDLARALNAGVQSARAQATEEPAQPQNTQGQR